MVIPIVKILSGLRSEDIFDIIYSLKGLFRVDGVFIIVSHFHKLKSSTNSTKYGH